MAAHEEAFRRYLDAAQPRPAAMSALGLAVWRLLRSDVAIGSGWLSRMHRLLRDVPECAEHGDAAQLELEMALEQSDLDTVVEKARLVHDIGRRQADPNLLAIGDLGEGRALVRQGQVAEGDGTARRGDARDAVGPAEAGVRRQHLLPSDLRLPRARRPSPGAMDALGRGTYDQLLVAGFLPLTGELPARLADGVRVADIGCGSGHCINLMAQAYPASQFVGYDIAEDAIGRARDEATAMGLANASFEVLDAAALPAKPGFAAVFAFDAIHDQADPAAVLRRAHAALPAGGWFVMVDIKASSDVAANLDNPLAPFLYAESTLHCLTVSLAQGGAGLGAVWGEQLACRMLAEAGFGDIETHDAPGDPLDLVYVCRKP